MSVETIVQDGRERVVMGGAVYKDLVDSRDHAVVLRDVAGGAPVFTSLELDVYLAAPTPLAHFGLRFGRGGRRFAFPPYRLLTLFGECVEVGSDGLRFANPSYVAFGSPASGWVIFVVQVGG